MFRRFAGPCLLILCFAASPKSHAQEAEGTESAAFGTVTGSSEVQVCFQLPYGSYSGTYTFSGGNTSFQVEGGTMSVSPSSLSSYGTNCLPVYFTPGNATGSLDGSTSLLFTEGEGRNLEIVIDTSGMYR